jgi:ankyrin repeat protein
MEAVKAGYTDVIAFLLESGADIMKRNREGKTAIDLADEGTNAIIRDTLAQAAVDQSEPGSAVRRLC